MRNNIVNHKNLIIVFFVWCLMLTVTACGLLEDIEKLNERPKIQWATISAVYEKDEKKLKIEVKVFFDKEVIVRGTPSIDIITSFSDEEGRQKKDALYMRGSGSTTLVFVYFMNTAESEYIKRAIKRVEKYTYQFIPSAVGDFSFENGYITDTRNILLPRENKDLKRTEYALQKVMLSE